MQTPEMLLRFVPAAPDWRVPWEQIDSAVPLQAWIGRLQQTQQNPQWHGEGDVWTHTQMVCEALTAMEGFRSLPERQRQELFLAALFHDFGKAVCSRLEDGNWTSPDHGAVGARVARELLWLEWGLCGTPDRQKFRETICTLIRYHGVPPHILDQRNPQRRLLQIASAGELLPDFQIELLCLLEQADMTGRICPSERKAESMEILELCRSEAEMLDCLHNPFPFPDAYSAYACLQGRNVVPGQSLYDDTWGECILLCGLPGTGKDTWIRTKHPDLPVVSLDDLRVKLKITPEQAQGTVAQAAREQAQQYLRWKQAFIWNATSLTADLRQRQIRLFTDYHARVRIVYLETDWQTQMLRNRSRSDAVPEAVIRAMLQKLVPPERFEAHRVDWQCV